MLNDWTKAWASTERLNRLNEIAARNSDEYVATAGIRSEETLRREEELMANIVQPPIIKEPDGVEEQLIIDHNEIQKLREVMDEIKESIARIERRLEYL